MILHRLIQLSIEHEGRTAEYWLLSKVPQKGINYVCKIDYCGLNFHGVQSHVGIHALETGRVGVVEHYCTTNFMVFGVDMDPTVLIDP